MPKDRYALCFDSDKECLGETALRLLRMGIDVLYAKTAEEAFLLANDARDSIRAVIVPPSVAIEDLDRVVQRIDGALESRLVSMVVIGDQPTEEVRARLRGAGAEWAVWNVKDDSALRFALNGAMTLPNEVFPRSEKRIPTSLMASYWIDDVRGDAVAYTLSAKGAFLETPRSAAVGALLKIEIWLPSVRFSTAAKVIYVHAHSDRSRASWPVGMGIVFEDLSEKLEAELRSYIDERAESTSI